VVRLFLHRRFDFKKRGELYWLYVTLTVLVLFFIFEFTGPFLTPRRVVSVTRQTHPMYYLALARICIVNLLLILGVIVAVLSNIAIIAPLKLTDFPKTHFTTTDLLALGALAYLFSKGIGDVIDGVKQIREKKLEGQPAA
jgi:ABC-type xylose transport system permease subunit